MAIKRKDIRAILENDELSIEDRVKGIMDLAHVETDQLRDEADALRQELTKANADLEEANGKITDKQTALDTVTSDFEAYKTQSAVKQENDSKANAYKTILKEAGISDKRIAQVMKVTDLSEFTLNKDGSIRDTDKVKANVLEEWAEFIPVTETINSEVATPPNLGHVDTKMTKEEIMAVKDRDERRRLIQENPDAFR